MLSSENNLAIGAMDYTVLQMNLFLNIQEISPILGLVANRERCTR